MGKARRGLQKNLPDTKKTKFKLNPGPTKDSGPVKNSNKIVKVMQTLISPTKVFMQTLISPTKVFRLFSPSKRSESVEDSNATLEPIKIGLNSRKNSPNSSNNSKSNPNYSSLIKYSESTNHSELMNHSDSDIKNELSDSDTKNSKPKLSFSLIKDSKPMEDYSTELEAIQTMFDKWRIKNNRAPFNPAKNSEPMNHSKPTNHSGLIFDPKNDFAFKYIFGSPGSEDIAKCFANEFFGSEMKKHFSYIGKGLYYDYSEIQHVNFKSCDLNPNSNSKKEVCLVDLMFANQVEELYIIEMQVASEDLFLLLRMTFYAIKAWSNQLSAGNDYKSLKKVSIIVITAFDLFPNDDDYLRYHELMSIPTGGKGESVVIGRMVCINLAKFKVPINELKTPTERWCYFLRHSFEANKYNIEDVIGEYMIMDRVYDKVGMFYNSSELRTEFQQSIMDENDLGRMWDGAKNIGIQKGKIKGEIEIAINLIDMNIFSIPTISKITTLAEGILTILKEEVDIAKSRSEPISGILNKYLSDFKGIIM